MFRMRPEVSASEPRDLSPRSPRAGINPAARFTRSTLGETSHPKRTPVAEVGVPEGGEVVPEGVREREKEAVVGFTVEVD